MKTSLFCTTAKIGKGTGGGIVVFHELKALKKVTDVKSVLDMTNIIPESYQHKPHAFTRAYFDSDGVGYVGGGYRDFPCHYKTAEEILKRKPRNVLELGGARGYICKLLENHGVEAWCMDISEHCWHTRATDNFILHDATKPWNTSTLKKRGKIDLCFSIAFLEHIPEEKLEPLIKEMARVTKRGLHGITFQITPNDTDKTHCTIHPKEWWVTKFEEVAPAYPVEIVDKEDLEQGIVNISKYAPPDGLMKLNIGSFKNMFHGWVNIDLQPLATWAKMNGYLFKQIDVRNGLPYGDDQVDLIVANHFIEHLSIKEGAAFLRECFRVLKPSGIIRLGVPDAKLLCEKYLDGTIMEYRHVNLGVEKAGSSEEALSQLLLAGHETIYNENSLTKILKTTGFIQISKMSPFTSASNVIKKQTISTYPTLSCYVEGRKP